jgi:predicted nucleic acid-binding protein
VYLLDSDTVIYSLKGHPTVMRNLSLHADGAEVFGMLKAQLEREGTRLDDFDLAVAACALTHNLILVTNNTEHFSRIQGLRIENWAETAGD